MVDALSEPRLTGIIQPFTARNLIASALLGTHPPSLPGRMLVAMVERFGISAGAARVALSRMVERGELLNSSGRYSLGAVLRERQDRQEQSRVLAATWDGTWEQVLVTGSARPAADRARLRRELTRLGLGELREGVWMRPANLDPARQPISRDHVAANALRLTVAPIELEQGRSLVAALFDLDSWAETASVLDRALHSTIDELGEHDDAIVRSFTIAAATLRHFVHDPQLPADLMPPEWPAERLRRTFDVHEVAFRELMADFFRSVGR